MITEQTIPSPRAGLLRHWDTLIGPGATRGEERLILAAAILGTLAVLCNAWARDLGWTFVQYLVAGVLALDIFGGVTANTTTAAKRWYHRPGQTRRHHLVFVAVHIVQMAMAGVFFLWGDGDVGWFALMLPYGYLMTFTVVILWSPEGLRRPVAYSAFAGALLLSFYLVPVVPGLEWFLPALYFKLLVSHLLPD